MANVNKIADLIFSSNPTDNELRDLISIIRSHITSPELVNRTDNSPVQYADEDLPFGEPPLHEQSKIVSHTNKPRRPAKK